MWCDSYDYSKYRHSTCCCPSFTIASSSNIPGDKVSSNKWIEQHCLLHRQCDLHPSFCNLCPIPLHINLDLSMIASLLWASSGSFYQNKHRGLKKRNGVFYLSKRNQIVNSMCTYYESQITTFPINEFIKLLNFIVISCHVGKNPNNLHSLLYSHFCYFELL